MRPQHIDSIEVPIGDCMLKRTDSGAELILGNGKSFSITIPESCILDRLCKSAGDVVVKDELILEAWGSAEIIGPNSLPVAITNLRKVLEIDNIKILNVPRKGYRIQIPERKKEIEFRQMESADIDLPSYQVGALVTKSMETNTSNKHQFYLSAFLFLACVYVLFFLLISWVNIECERLENGEVCYVEGDKPNLFLMNNKSGEFYYSSQSGMISRNN